MIHDSPLGATIDVRVIPRARASALAGTRHDAVLVRLAAPPVDGAANAALLAFLADTLNVPLKSVALVAGERSRGKRVRVAGLSAAVVRARLGIEDPAR